MQIDLFVSEIAGYFHVMHFAELDWIIRSIVWSLMDMDWKLLDEIV